MTLPGWTLRPKEWAFSISSAPVRHWVSQRDAYEQSGGLIRVANEPPDSVAGRILSAKSCLWVFRWDHGSDQISHRACVVLSQPFLAFCRQYLDSYLKRKMNFDRGASQATTMACTAGSSSRGRSWSSFGFHIYQQTISSWSQQCQVWWGFGSSRTNCFRQYYYLMACIAVEPQNWSPKNTRSRPSGRVLLRVRMLPFDCRTCRQVWAWQESVNSQADSMSCSTHLWAVVSLGLPTSRRGLACPAPFGAFGWRGTSRWEWLRLVQIQDWASLTYHFSQRFACCSILQRLQILSSGLYRFSNSWHACLAWRLIARLAPLMGCARSDFRLELRGCTRYKQVSIFGFRFENM